MLVTRDDAPPRNPGIVDYGPRGGYHGGAGGGRRGRDAAPVLRRALRERGLRRQPRQLSRRVQVVRAVPLDQQAGRVHVQQPLATCVGDG